MAAFRVRLRSCYTIMALSFGRNAGVNRSCVRHEPGRHPFSGSTSTRVVFFDVLMSLWPRESAEDARWLTAAYRPEGVADFAACRDENEGSFVCLTAWHNLLIGWRTENLSKTGNLSDAVDRQVKYDGRSPPQQPRLKLSVPGSVRLWRQRQLLIIVENVPGKYYLWN